MQVFACATPIKCPEEFTTSVRPQQHPSEEPSKQYEEEQGSNDGHKLSASEVNDQATIARLVPDGQLDGSVLCELCSLLPTEALCLVKGDGTYPLYVIGY